MNKVILKTSKTYEIEKSEFIAILYPLNKEEDVLFYLSEARKEYPKARHYVYAYIYRSKKRFSDDHEPSGTAGKPLLSLLEKNNLDETLIIVVRYFGGTLLGATRLLRSYMHSAELALEAATIKDFSEYYRFQFSASYEEYNKLEKFLMNVTYLIEKIKYDTRIEGELLLKEDLSKELGRIFLDLKLDFIDKVYR